MFVREGERGALALAVVDGGRCFAIRAAHVSAILSEAQSCLAGRTEMLRPGQVRVVLVRQGAGAGRPLSATPTVEITWTVDAGAEDRQVLAQHGHPALRQVRLQRLLDEAVEQGGVAT